VQVVRKGLLDQLRACQAHQGMPSEARQEVINQ